MTIGANFSRSCFGSESISPITASGNFFSPNFRRYFTAAPSQHTTASALSNKYKG